MLSGDLSALLDDLRRVAADGADVHLTWDATTPLEMGNKNATLAIATVRGN